MIFIAVQKAFRVVTVSSLEVAYLRTERQWWVHNTDICLGLPPLPHGSRTDRLTQTHSIAEAFDTTCSLEACQPAHLLSHRQKFTPSQTPQTHTGIWKLISDDESEGVTLVSHPGKSQSGAFFSKACIGRRKERRKLIYFFCFGNWGWHASLSKCDPFKHFRGKSVVPASISVTSRTMFSPARLLYDEKTTRRTLRLWHIEDESTLHFCANWGCLCEIWQVADISFSQRFGFEMDLAEE